MDQITFDNLTRDDLEKLKFILDSNGDVAVRVIIESSPGGEGDVIGPSSAIDSNFASFNGVTGKLIKDSGKKASDFQSALGFTPENSANKGQANGYAPLGGDSKISSTYLPSYVDDVVEVSTYADLPVTGETGKIYIVLTGVEANREYRWSGTVYVEIKDSGESEASLGTLFDIVTSKTTPVDADKFSIRDSISGLLQVVTWSNIKATLKTYFDNLTTTLTNKTIALGSNTVSGTKAQFDTAVTDGNIVYTDGNQTIADVKTFSSFPVTPSSAPTTDYQVANKKYVDDNAGGSDFDKVIDFNIFGGVFSNITLIQAWLSCGGITAQGTTSNNYFYSRIPPKPNQTSYSGLNWNDVSVLEIEGDLHITNFSGGQIGIGIDANAYYAPASTNNKLLLYYSASDTYKLNTANGTTQSYGNNITLSTSAFSHRIKIVFTYGVDIKIYANGTLVDTKTTNLPQGANPMYFGFGGFTTSYYQLNNTQIRIKYA